MPTVPPGPETKPGKPLPLFFHGTRVALLPGDLIAPGYTSNYGSQRKAKHVYFSATLDAAAWGAELAQGKGMERIYRVEPTGPYENDPNLTDKKFPGNPTRSYRSLAPLRVLGELESWAGHSQQQIAAMKQHLQQLKEQGIEAIDD